MGNYFLHLPQMQVIYGMVHRLYAPFFEDVNRIMGRHGESHHQVFIPGSLTTKINIFLR